MTIEIMGNTIYQHLFQVSEHVLLQEHLEVRSLHQDVLDEDDEVERLHDDEGQWQEELPSSLSSVSITVSIATDTQHTADTLPAL